MLEKGDPPSSSTIGLLLRAVASNHIVGRGEIVGGDDIVGDADGLCDTVGAELIVGDTEGAADGVKEGYFVGVAVGLFDGSGLYGGGVGLLVGSKVKVPQGMLHVQGHELIKSKMSWSV